MAKFCSKCGKEIKPGNKFCTFCGAPFSSNPVSEPIKPTEPAPPARSGYTEGVAGGPPPPPPPPPPSSGSGCGTGCLVGCLIVVLGFLVMAAILAGLFWYLFMREKDPGSYFEIDSASKSAKVVECSSSNCLETNLKTCSPAEGEADIGDFAASDIKILGKSEDDPDSCVVYAKITEIKEMPEELESVPGFVLDNMTKNLSLECLVPESEYKQGIEAVGQYISDNLIDACKGPLLDFIDKFGIEVED